jgi:hypothetical protein
VRLFCAQPLYIRLDFSFETGKILLFSSRLRRPLRIIRIGLDFPISGMSMTADAATGVATV